MNLFDPQAPYIIAEASGNHAQDRQQARLLVQAAAAAGANAIKYQTFTAEEICADVPILFGHDAAHDAWCQSLGVTRLRQLFAKGGLPRAWHRELQQEARGQGIEFLSTPFSVDAAKFLVEEVGVPALKIASGDLTFEPLHQYADSIGLPVIISTGGATMDEIWGMSEAYGHDVWCNYVALLHCVSVYPCDQRILNLAALPVMREHFNVPIGFSDHTLSTDLVPAMAVALGATIFEKHLRLATDTSSVDVAHSLDPEGFTRYVDTIRTCCQIQGNGIKTPHRLEAHDQLWARRDPSDWLRPTQGAREGAWA